MTINWADGDAYYNYSVGKVCRDVIASRLEVYRDEMRFSFERWHRYDYGPITKEWWRARKGRNLAELQIEAIDWAIERRKDDPEAEDHEDEIAALKMLRDGIARSGKPAIPGRMLRMVVTDK